MAALVERTKVAIIGGGPAGQLLARMLSLDNIDCMLLEKRSADYVLSRIRAGLLEQGTVDTLREVGCGVRLDEEALIHDGTFINFDGEGLRVDFQDLVGRRVTIYGQTEVTRDLMEANAAAFLAARYEAEVSAIEDVAGPRPRLRYTWQNSEHVLEADWIVGADGFHGVSRSAIPAALLKTFERVYPFGWLGILADVPPCSHELIYANHPDGFALATMRSPTRTRAYIQVPAQERIENWPDERFWQEYCRRLGPEAAARVLTGPSIEKSIAPLRSFVAEPMRHGRLLLAGDAAHIVPPTGAKGLNLAVSDVRYAARALAAHYKARDDRYLEAYSATCLRRVWKAVRFSWWMTRLLHQFPDSDAFERAVQRTEFEYLRSSRAAQLVLAENYTGLPVEW